MYVPAPFAETRLPVLHDAIRRSGIATLVTSGEGGLEASHVPMLLDPEPQPYGTLLCHVARDNPQWRSAGKRESLAIFLGPDAYVSPSTYASKARNPRVVPTWNYVAIHAYGRLQWFDDEARLRDLVTRLTQRQEGPRERPWAVGDAPDDYVRAMLRAIVGLALPIARLEGKWKMSQNRPPEDRASAAAALARDGNEAVASLITGALDPPRKGGDKAP